MPCTQRQFGLKMDFFELGFLILAGLLAGAVVGMLPGVGTTTCLLGMYPLISTLSLQGMFVFYIAMIGTTQYFGSITAIIFGSAGEVTSQPAVTYGHPIFLEGKSAPLLAATATASFIGSIIGIIILYIASVNQSWLSLVMSNTVRLIIFVSTILLLIATSKQYLTGSIAAMSGILLGSVGYNWLFNSRFLVPQFTSLDAGISIMPIFIGLLVLPTLVDFAKFPVHRNLRSDPAYTFKKKLLLLVTTVNKLVILRSSVVGAVTGLIPGISYIISSFAAVAIEKKLHNNNHSNLVIAAESANNAGAITALIPLLLLAIPIIPSETLILGMAEQHGFGMDSSLKFLTLHLNLFASVLIVVSFINVFLSGMMYSVYIRVFEYLNAQVYYLLFFALLGITLANAYIENQLLLTAVILAVSFSVGRLIKSSAVKSIIIMSFFLSDEIVNELYRFYIFNF